MTILCYHGVEHGWTHALNVPPDDFARQVGWLGRTRTVVDLEQALDTIDRDGALPRRAVALTFDDGFSGVLDHALPVLEREGIPAVVFVVVGTFDRGQAIDWVRGGVPGHLRTLTRHEIVELHTRGIRIGSHSYSHRDLPTLPDDVLADDLRRSREVLEDLLGTAVPWLAYPRGLHDERVRGAAAAAGYSHALSLPVGAEPTGRYAVPRAGVYGGNPQWAVKFKASPLYLRAKMSAAGNLTSRLQLRLTR